MANDRFDQEAAAWDNNPVTVKSSKLAFGSLLEHVPDLADEDEAKGMRPLLLNTILACACVVLVPFRVLRLLHCWC